MAEQVKDNQAKEERISEKEDQTKVELTSDNKVGSSEEEYIDKDDTAQDEEEVVKPSSFPKFMLLPIELRLVIWEYALPEPRTLRVCPKPETDDEDEDEDDDDDEKEYVHPYERRFTQKDQWGLPSSAYAPEILNPEKFWTFPLAAVCQESREFIIDFGYELLYEGLMNEHGTDIFEGLWFCRGYDEIEEFTDELIVQFSKGHSQGDWIYK
ncbi:hypothetical protein FHL15_000552 [Xylaria flabelliformis]|uniref:2EXR domain-containing protein n=1 Tax=Xylaria flabelliformis TaxID=2512241 RepID=A0A553IE48_9PEZI|nr:hypothetical protein FHL15_000552 [Xylaria flabelliformis]